MTEDPLYNPAWPLYMALDFGWWNNFIGWVQPSRNGDRVIMLYGDYQEMRTNDENAKLALAIHQARGYGQLTGGWGYSSKPTALRAYSQVFGVEILGPPGRVENGQELVKQWLKAALMTKGTSGLSFSRHGPKRLFQEMQGYREHVPGTGPTIRWMRPGPSLSGWAGA